MVGGTMSATQSYFREFGTHEKNGRYCEALNVLAKACRDEAYLELRNVVDLNIHRLAERAKIYAATRD